MIRNKENVLRVTERGGGTLMGVMGKGEDALL